MYHQCDACNAIWPAIDGRTCPGCKLIADAPPTLTKIPRPDIQYPSDPNPPGLHDAFKANQRQVGGDHYGPGGGLQHWDVVHIFQLDYYLGNATKYLFRCGKKGTPSNWIEDLKKAAHYIEKKIELLQKEHPDA